jgi:hypothetical protein
MMMLAGSSKPLEYAVYIRLPEQMARMFAGYEKCEAPSESQVIGLYGHQEDLNEYIDWRLDQLVDVDQLFSVGPP